MFMRDSLAFAASASRRLCRRRVFRQELREEPLCIAARLPRPNDGQFHAIASPAQLEIEECTAFALQLDDVLDLGCNGRLEVILSIAKPEQQTCSPRHGGRAKLWKPTLESTSRSRLADQRPPLKMQRLMLVVETVSDVTAMAWPHGRVNA
ncbi:MAG: hypothetical protein IV092_19545 [Burkholderiaceae bacterium]|nr:hypothetical protein [Burkholderiaceae bacterium]